MRRLKYNPFVKPVNFGEWDSENLKFILDKNITEGLYIAKIIDSGYNGVYSLLIFIKKDFEYNSQAFESFNSGETTKLYFDAIHKNVLESGAGAFDDGTIIELYKID